MDGYGYPFPQGMSFSPFQQQFQPTSTTIHLPPSQTVVYPPPQRPPRPPQLPVVDQYAVLWKLAEEYFTSAQKLSLIAARSGDKSLQDYHKLLLGGIKCLNAVLLLDQNMLPIKVEMHTRIKLAEVLLKETDNIAMAEDLLSKGILRIPKIPEFYDLKFAMQQMQAVILIRTSFKAARAHIKTCLDEARDRERLLWGYSFLLTGLNHTIPNPDTHEITHHLNTISYLRSLSQQNGDYELVELSCLLEIHYALTNNLTAINIDTLLTLSNDASVRNPLREQNIHLSILRILFHILHLIRNGHNATALNKLREYHQLMDFVVSKENISHDGRFELLVGRGSKLWFSWLGQSESFVVGYILSGMVYIPDSTVFKGLSFLNEGVKVLDGMLNGEKAGEGMWLSEVIAQQDRWKRLKRYTILYLAFAHLTRSNWEEANRTIHHLRSLPPITDPVASHLFSMLIATQAQYHGHFDTAKEYYAQIPSTAGEIYLLALLNQTVLYRDLSNPSDLAKSTRFLKEVEERLGRAGAFTPNGPTVLPQIKAAYTLVKGLISPELLKSKDMLSKVITQSHELTNTQIRLMGYTGLAGRYFKDISTEQVEKLSMMGYVAAQKAHNELWLYITGNLLADVFLKQDKGLKKEKQDSINREIRAGVEKMLNMDVL